MYLTAHRVKADDGKEGVNAFRHRHEMPLVDYDAQKIAEANPGNVVESCIEVRPGGNSVISYLDVACPEDSIDEIEKGISAARSMLATQKSPVNYKGNNFGIRFGYANSADGFEVEEFERLVGYIRRLL